MRLLLRFFMLLIAPWFSLSAFASGGGGPAFAEGVNYIDIKPPLIVNYGGTGKMRYIKAEISLRTENMEGAMEITHHLPLIRDKLIHILSQQTEETIATPEGKEKLRVFALAEVNKVLHAVEKLPGAEEKKDKKEKDKKSDKKKSEKDKKDDEESEVDEHKKADTGPASDLFFNNFVVQK